MFEEKKELFRKWLIEDKGFSTKVAGDVISRCRRLDKQVLSSLDEAVLSPQSYLVALKDINTYAIDMNQEKKKETLLINTLRVAMKKYCEYINPESYECYPNGNSLSR